MVDLPILGTEDLWYSDAADQISMIVWYQKLKVFGFPMLESNFWITDAREQKALIFRYPSWKSSALASERSEWSS